MKKDNITPQIDYFLDVVEHESQEKKSSKHTIFKIETSELAGQMALWYEKVRTAVQYKEEHLLRRTAIYRILKRLILFEQRRRKKALTYAFFLELAMAGYIQQKDANDEKFRETQRIISRYLVAINSVGSIINNPAEALEIRRWLLNLASEEIENLISPQKEKMALIYSIYETLRPKIKFSLEKLPYPLSGSRAAGLQSMAEEYLGVGSLIEPLEDRFSKNVPKNQTDIQKTQMEKLLNMLTYLSIFRNLRRSDRAMLRALIFNIYFPNWVNLNADEEEAIAKIMRNFVKRRKEIEIVAEHPLVTRILYPIKKYMLSASFFYEAVMDNPREARSIVNQEFLLHEKIKGQCNSRYTKEKQKLRKRIFRGFLYVFLTKMLVALIIEVPYEALKSTAIQYKSLLINLLFPPVLLTAIASSARSPNSEDTKEIIKNTELLIYHGKQEEDLKEIRITDRESALAERFLDLFYIILFVGLLYTLIKTLAWLDFNFVAMFIFLIFAGTVSFFGALIRQSIRDLVITKDQEGFFSLIFDTILLPFVRFGRLLSVKFSRINVFIFILDFLIEAPFKFIIRAFEAWIEFLRRKRDEIERQFD